MSFKAEERLRDGDEQKNEQNQLVNHYMDEE